ncbi:MAG: hypothetical protein LH624_11655 [Cryobacterium sp.]|nr:hypothetical protein [Cryobacterium sp.]
MEQTAEQTYIDLLRQLARPTGTHPGVLAETFRDVERMHSAGQITDWQLHNAREAYARTAGSKVGDAAHWVVDKAKDTLQSAAGQIRERASTGVVTYTKNDPVRAILIAAATGAILMSLISMVARSGVRTVRLKIQR